MKEAFEDLIKDIYNAEKQIEKALPKVIKKVTDAGLKQALTMHLEETKSQTKRVEEIASMRGFKPSGKVCMGMKGILEEGEEHMSEEPGAVLDANFIAASQKIEHYEICNYGTARAWAQQLGYTDVIPLIEGILAEEENADKKLTEIAEGRVNMEAMQESKESKSAKSNGSSKKAKDSKSASKSSSPRGKVSVR